MPTSNFDDTEDSSSQQEEETRCVPFHLYGAGCFVFAILISIATVITVPLLEEEASFTGTLFRIMFGCFLLFLFCCIFCTYYLGGSKATWETPEFVELSLKFSNVITVFGIIFEFLQLWSFSFNGQPEARFAGSEILRTIGVLAVPANFVDGDAFTTLYWLIFVISFSPYIFVIFVRLAIYSYSNRKGEEAAQEVIKIYQDKIYSVLWFLVNTLYFPVISTMLAGVDCTSSENENYLDANPQTICFTGTHVGMMLGSLISLVIYYPAASFAQSQTQNISDIKFKPKIIFVMLQGKLVLAGVAVFFTTFQVLFLLTVLLVDIVFLSINTWFRPCLVDWVNWLRTAFFAVSLWSTICSLLALSNDNTDNATPLVLLLIGSPAIFVAVFFAYGVYKAKIQKKTENPT